MIRFRMTLATLAVAALLSQTASAHFLWVVTEAGKVRVYFGEAAEPDAPELLDKVVKAEVWSVGGGRRAEPKPVTLKKVDAALEGTLEGPATSVILRHTYGVLDRGGETFLLKYAAKTYPSPLPGTWPAVKDDERLPLEIVPKQEGTALVVKVTFNGEPVEGDQVVVSGPSVIKLEANTDKDGLARFELSKEGLFSIRARHTEATKGELDGKAYASVRHYSTLSLNYVPTKLSPTKVTLPNIPHSTTSFGGAVAGDTLYVYGGNYGSAHQYSNEEQSGDLWALDLKNPAKWEQLAGGPKLQGLAMVEHKGKLYRVGGFTALNKMGDDQNLQSQTDFASYDPQTKQWTQLPALPEGRSSHDAAMLGDMLYVVGGWNLQGESRGSKWHETALACNLAADKLEWKPVAAPPFRRRAVAVATFENKLYCLGGMQETGGTTTAVAIYDAAADKWTEGPSLLGGSMDGFGASAFACDGSLYVTTMSGSIQRLAGDKWEFLGQLAHPRFFHRMLPWQDEKLVVVGGASMTVGKIDPLEMLSLAGLKTAAK